MSNLNTTAARLLHIASEDPKSNRWSWAVICIGAGGIRHNHASGNPVFLFEDGSAIQMVGSIELGERPFAFDGTYNNGYAFAR